MSNWLYLIVIIGLLGYIGWGKFTKLETDRIHAEQIQHLQEQLREGKGSAPRKTPIKVTGIDDDPETKATSKSPKKKTEDSRDAVNQAREETRARMKRNQARFTETLADITHRRDLLDDELRELRTLEDKALKIYQKAQYAYENKSDASIQLSLQEKAKILNSTKAQYDSIKAKVAITSKSIDAINAEQQALYDAFKAAQAELQEAL